MTCRALQRRQLDRTGLAAEFLCEDAAEDTGRAGQLLVTKGINIVLVLIAELHDVLSVRRADALGDTDDNRILLLEETLTFRNESVHIKGKLREVDGVRTVAILALGECGGAGQPAGVPAHNLDDDDLSVRISHRPAVADNLLYGGSDVLRGGAVARRVVGQREVIVDRLRAADKADLRARDNAVVRQLLDRVHRVVAADVDKAVDLEILKDLEDLLIERLVLMDLRKLVAAAAEI